MSLGARFARGARALTCCACALAQGCDGDLVNLGRTQGLTGGSAGAGASAGSAAAGEGGSEPWQLRAQPIVAQEEDILLANPTLTADLQTLYFTRQPRRGADTRTSVLRANLAGSTYDSPAFVMLGDLASVDVASPAISPDGAELWLGLNLPAPQGLGGTDVWLARSTADGFTTPELVVELSSAFDDAPRPPTATGTLMALSSKRHGCCFYQIYLTERADASAPWTQPSRDLLGNVNDAASQSADGFLADGGLELYFSSNREGQQSDLYVARRASLAEPFGSPSPLAALNSPSSEERMPWLSDDKKHLFFASNRSGEYALYRADR